MNRTVGMWAAQASHLIGDCFDHAKPLIDQDYEGLPPQVRFVAAQLFIDCHLSSESTLILLKEGKEWDADLVGRAVMEGSMKFAYMLYGSKEEIQEKVREYWDVLPLFSVIRHGEHARSFLAEVPDPEAIEWMPLHELLVEPAEVSAIRSRYTKRDRQIVEERWSFSGICKTFALTGDPGMRLLAGLAHGYSMSSHLVHKDADGVGMVWERYRREPHRRVAVSMAHSARVISDACSFGRLRLLSLLRACHSPVDELDAINERYVELDEALKAANDHFSKTEYPSDT